MIPQVATLVTKAGWEHASFYTKFGKENPLAFGLYSLLEQA